MRISVAGHHFILSHHKTIFWEEERILLLSDLHLTKEAHFRKHGIAVPPGITEAILQKLKLVISEFSPERVLFLGDLFHSEENKGMQIFSEWKKTITQVKFSLVEGNHDIMHRRIYEKMEIELLGETLAMKQIIFSHKPLPDAGKINFCGHVHPSVTIHGKARQSIRLPCFHYNQVNFILPAFGAFTGTKSIQIHKNDNIYAVAEKEVILIQ